MKTYALILLILFSGNSPLCSQTDSLKNSFDTTDLRKSFDEEILLEGLNSEDEDSKLLDFLQSLKLNPYDLNKITPAQLLTIPFLNSIIAKNIIEYKNQIKTFKSKRALLKVEGVSEELYEKIKFYFVVRQSIPDILIDETGKRIITNTLKVKNKLKLTLHSKFLQDLQQKAGYTNGKYEGSRLKIYNKLNLKYTNEDFMLEGNLTSEKDPGEKNFTDFISGFIELKNYKAVKDFVAGDYTLNFGQGLAMWSGQSFSKGIEVVNSLKKKGKGIDGYSSTNETQFFRGAASKINFHNFNLNLFYSDNFYNATIDTTINGVSSFYYDGYHRTSSEIRRKNSVKEKLFGTRVTYEKGSLRLGSTYWTSNFSRLIIPDSLKKLYKFSGTNANVLGLDYDLIIKNMNLYGEMARSQSGAIASVNSIQFTFLKFADLVFLYRNYPKDFSPVHSFGFGERSGDTYNERGFYSGIKLRPLKGLLINSYYDQYEFPYRTYFNPVPTAGNDFLTNIEWRASKGFVINLKYKNENKEETRTVVDNQGRDTKKIDNRNQLNVRTGFIYYVTDRFRVRSRFEYVFVDYKNFGGDKKGFLFFSDVRIIPIIGLVFDTRFIFFNTDDYDSRIYEFENDIKGVMSNTALYGKGRRWYAVLKYKPFSHFEISAKYAETFYEGVKSIGSGNDKIAGDVNSKLSVGVEVGF